MFETIRWRCHAHVADRPGAERIVGRLGALSPLPLEIEGYERYWKFPELAELRMVSPLKCATPDSALLTTLECASKFATPWSLFDPAAHNAHEFEGIASANVGARFTVPGIEWMHFYVTGEPPTPSNPRGRTPEAGA